MHVQPVVSDSGLIGVYDHQYMGDYAYANYNLGSALKYGASESDWNGSNEYKRPANDHQRQRKRGKTMCKGP